MSPVMTIAPSAAVGTWNSHGEARDGLDGEGDDEWEDVEA